MKKLIIVAGIVALALVASLNVVVNFGNVFAATGTIIFNGNGHTQGTPPSNITVNTTDPLGPITVPGTFRKEGFHLLGFYNAVIGGSRVFTAWGAVADGAPNLILDVNDQVHLHARWQANSGTIVIDSNGRPAGDEPVIGNVTTGDTWSNISITPAFMSWGSRNLLGIYTAEGERIFNANGTLYANANPNIVVAVNSGETRLYARWSEAETIIISFNTGTGATLVQSQTIERTFGTVTKPNNPTRPGFSFNGWTYNGNPFEGWSTASGFESDATIVANWTPMTFTVTVDGTDITFLQTNTNQIYHQSLNVPTRAGYTFLGFYTDPGSWNNRIFDEEGNRAFNGSWSITSNQTLTARWVPENTSGGNFFMDNLPWFLIGGAVLIALATVLTLVFAPKPKNNIRDDENLGG